MLSALSCRTTRMLIALSLPSRAMVLLLASWLRRLTLTSTLFRSAAAMFRLLSSKLLARLASLLSVLSMLLTSVTAMLSRLCRIAAAKLNVRLQISVPVCYFRTVKTHLRFAMANAILVLQLHKVSQLLLFQAQQDKCDILRAGQDNTQRIIDTLNNHWKDEQALKIQDLKFELSQERQNNMINERFNRLGNCGCGGNSCGCGCGQ